MGKRRANSKTRSPDKVVCETPTPGKQPTRIDRWKYDLVRGLLLKLLPKKGEGVRFADLPGLVEGELSMEDRKHLGSTPWYVTTVKLDMEVKGEIKRVPRSQPQRLLRV